MALEPGEPSGSMVTSDKINVLPSLTASTSKSNVVFVEEPEDIETATVSVQDLIRDAAPPSPTSGRRSPPPPLRSSENREVDTTSPTRRKGKKKASLNQLERKEKRGPFLGKWNPSLTLQNTGSVARDHLASERTFLAYIRTSLTIASSGVALVQLFNVASSSNRDIERFSNPLGATVILIGFLTLVLGVVRYFSVQTALVEGNFAVARVSPASLALALMATIVAAFGVLVGAR